MCKRVPPFLAATVLVAGWLAVGQALAQGITPCERTARKMFTACELDVREEINIAVANCINISDRAARISCRQQQWATLEDERDACADQRTARIEACELLGEHRYDPDPLLDPALEFIDPNDIPDVYPTNPYVSLAAGHTYVLRAGEGGEEIVVVHVTGEIREISGVPCRVVVDAVVEAEVDGEEGVGVDYIAVEITDDWFAQDDQDNVYYCGELARNFEDGLLTDLDGSFESGKDWAKAGILIQALPQVGLVHRQEFALDEAEDIVQYIDLAAVPGEEMGGENETFPCAPGGCLQTLEFAPLEPESSEFKFYAPGTGFVLAVGMEDGEITGEREELVCVGDSLAILSDPSCGIEAPETLLAELCELAPDAFCPDEP